MFTFHQRPKRGAFVIPSAGQFPISEAGLRRARALPDSSPSLSRVALARHAAPMINHPRSPSRATRERGRERERTQNARINAADSPLIARVPPRRCFSPLSPPFFSLVPRISLPGMNNSKDLTLVYVQPRSTPSRPPLSLSLSLSFEPTRSWTISSLTRIFRILKCTRETPWRGLTSRSLRYPMRVPLVNHFASLFGLRPLEARNLRSIRT